MSILFSTMVRKVQGFFGVEERDPSRVGIQELQSEVKKTSETARRVLDGCDVIAAYSEGASEMETIKLLDNARITILDLAEAKDNNTPMTIIVEMLKKCKVLDQSDRYTMDNYMDSYPAILDLINEKFN